MTDLLTTLFAPARIMPPFQHPLAEVLERDSRYKREAYDFVREALGYAQDYLQMGREQAGEWEEDEERTVEERLEHQEPEDRIERHLTGQELCEAIRQYALEEYGLMAKSVLNSWGIYATGDFGEIVYNLIDVGLMKKSEHDRREDFDNVYDFDEALCRQFQITLPE
jgi:uncharacterized repeat protein (TIGR04138 family)